MDTKKRNSLKNIIILLGAIIILAPCFYFTIYRYIDSSICIPKVAKEIGVEPSQSGIYGYIEDTINDGMSHEEILDALDEVGHAIVTQKWDLSNGGYRETVVMRICSHVLNNPVLYMTFSYDEYLEDWMFMDFP